MKPSRSYLFYLLLLVLGGAFALALGWATNLIFFPNRVEAKMPITFNQMVNEALAEVPAFTAIEASNQVRSDPSTLVVDVRDPADIALTGLMPGAINVTLGTLTYKADHEVPPEWRDPNFQDFARPIITTCETGEMAALAGKLLKDMGYTNVHTLQGGTVAWKEAGYPTNAP